MFFVSAYPAPFNRSLARTRGVVCQGSVQRLVAVDADHVRQSCDCLARLGGDSLLPKVHCCYGYSTSFHSWQLQDPKLISSSHLGETDALGKFRVERKTIDPMGISTFLVAEGKACDLLSSAQIGKRPLQVRLQDESKIEVIVYDKTGKPIQNAKVAPKGMDFPDSFWSNYLSNAVIQLLQSNTDVSGRARLKGANAKHLESVQVDIEGRGSRSFELPKNWDRESPIELVWTDVQGALRCRVVDSFGDPIPKVFVVVSSQGEATNSLVIKKPTVSFSSCARTDDRGECWINNIPVDEVDVQSVNDDHRGTKASVGPVSIVPNSTVTVELKFPATKQVQFSVLDTSHFLAHPNFEVIFRKRTDKGYCFARGRTDEDGIGEVTLELGTWDVEVQHLTTLPDGYYLSGPIETQQIVVTKEDDPKPVPPILIAKGKVLEGTFDGVDLSELRADWIFVSIRDSTGKEVEYQGKYDLQGHFRVTLPLDFNVDEILKFEICYAPVTNRRSLTVVSKSPWKLTWNSQQANSE